MVSAASSSLTVVVFLVAIASAQQRGVVVPVQGDHWVGLFVEGLFSFRIAVTYNRYISTYTVLLLMTAP